MFETHAAREGVGLKREQLTTSTPICDGLRPVFFRASATAPNMTISASPLAFAIVGFGGL